MYWSLIDVVSKIVKTYGVDILSDPKFWHILSDSYSFGNDYALKAIYKSCLTDGYISELVGIKGLAEKTKTEIAHIVDSETKSNPGKEEEYAAVLFSVVIAIESCNKQDYSDFINRSNPQPAPAPKPGPAPKPNNNAQKPALSIKERIHSLTYYIIGLALALGGLVFLSAFYNGWWLFFIVLFTGFSQLFYCSAVSVNMDKAKNEAYKSTVLSLLLPVFCGFIWDALLSFLFFSEGFRRGLGSHLSGFPHSPEGPSFITFLLIIFYVLFVGFTAASCYGTNKSAPIKRCKLKGNTVIASGCIVAVLYLSVYFLPIIEREIRAHHDKIENERVENLRKELIRRNNQLHEARIMVEKELSFKKIRLGMAFDTAMKYANDEAEDISPYSNLSTYDFLVSSEDRIIDDVLKTDPVNSEEEFNYKNYYSGQSYTVKILLDNKNLYLTLYEFNGSVFAMIIAPGSFRGATFGATEFDELLKLYSSKYGEPENLGSPLLDDTENYGIADDKYLWQFKNGAIQLTNNAIVYITADFIESAGQTFTNEKRIKEEREKRIADSIRMEQNRSDSIRREKARQDSIRRAHSHQNAINEI